MSLTIRDLMTDADLFGDQFAGDSWKAWQALLAGFFGLALDDAELEHWRTLTQQEQPQEAAEELWLVIGRRGGKSQCAALLIVFLACFFDYTDRLSPGEVATVACLAADRKQARVIFRYVSGLLNSNPMLKRLIVSEDKESITLSNRVVIEIGTASFRSTRGYTFAGVIADELAFWRSDESANPDSEILNALRPGLGTLNGKLICLSSPYSKRGELWNTYRRYYGKPGPVLVAQTDTRTMNPTFPERLIKQAYERDPEAAKAEYGGQFRSDLEAFIQRETVEACTRRNQLKLPYVVGVQYVGFVDPSGGGADEFTLAIGHVENERRIVDLVEARKGVPAEIAQEYAALLKEYRIHTIEGDRYGGTWPADEFGRCGIKYQPSKKVRTDLYIDLLPTLNSSTVELPPDDRLVNQLCALERRTSRSGKDSIDHPTGGHDDRANAVAGVVSLLADHRQNRPAVFGTYGIPADNRPPLYKNEIFPEFGPRDIT